MNENSKLVITMGGDFGDTGKGAQNSRLVYGMLQALGIYGDGGYASRLSKDPFGVIEHDHALLNVTPFGAGNAGNHIYLPDGGKVATHLLPPAVVWTPYTISLLGALKTVNLETLQDEIEDANEKGCRIEPGINMFLDRYATITLPQDVELDRATSTRLRGTFQGSGPSHARRRLRYDPRAADLSRLDAQDVRERIHQGVEMYNILLKWYGVREYSFEETMNWLRTWAERYGSDFVVDGERLVRLAMNNPNARIFVNGTQGPLLDGDMGTIGNTVSYGVYLHDALKGCHLPVSVFQDVSGRIVIVKKAYVTRAGSGVFPGEFENEKGARLARLGDEIGVTSGNVRRTGPDNLFETRRQVEMCVPGITSLAIPKVDILGEFMEIEGEQRAIVGYHKNGQPVEHVSFPGDFDEIVWGKPYQWGRIAGDDKKKMVREGFSAFPEGLQKYLRFTAEVTRAPVSSVSLGPCLGDTVTKGLYEETSDLVKV